MLKVIVVIFLSLSIYSKDLKIAYFSLPPFAYEEDGVAKGISVENFNKIAKKLNWTVNFVIYPFPRILHELEKEKVDAILLLGKNEARDKIYSYPTSPSAADHPGIAISKSVKIAKIKSVDDLKGIEIGVPSKGYISPFMKSEKIKIVALNSGMDHMKSNLEALAKRRDLQAVYLPTISSLRFIGIKEKLLDKIRFLETPEAEDHFYTVFKKSIDPMTLKMYNEQNKVIVKFHEK